MKKLRTVAVLLLAIALLGSLGVYALGTYGSESDPLITLSYLEKVLRPELEKQFAAETEAALKDYAGESDHTRGYTHLTLKAGQTLVCKAGCEFLVRSGSAYVSQGFLNVTAGAEVKAKDWLQAHNLYMAVVEDACVLASGETALMVRGEYTVK